MTSTSEQGRAMVPFNDLSRASRAESKALLEVLGRVVESGWFVLGPEVERFERRFADYVGCRHGIGVASGTDAIRLALQGLGVGLGDEVVTVSFTCVPTVAGIIEAGATPVFADIDADRRTLSPNALEAAISPRTRAVVVVHLYGRCADLDPLLAIVRRHGIALVEDCAQAHGATYRGRRAGQFGDAAAFSFYPTKNLGALGDGGMVVTSRADMADRVRRLREYGQRERYEHVEQGINSRLDELQAAVLDLRLNRLDVSNARRRTIAARYDRAFRTLPVGLPSLGTDDEPAHHLYVVEVGDRARFRRELLERGVKTDVHYPVPVHLQPSMAALAPPQPLGATERLSKRIVSLPCFPELRDDEVERVIAGVRAVVGAMDEEAS